jgi:4-hydroxybenzoate polyprenyltransferase
MGVMTIIPATPKNLPATQLLLQCSPMKTGHRIHVLFFNHLDAWAVAFMFSTVALVIHDALSWQTMVLLTAVALGYWLAFALNDYYDAPLDRLDDDKRAGNFFTQGNVTAFSRFRWIAFILLWLLLLIFAQFGWRGIGLYALCLFIMWGYSAPPLRCKQRPLLDLLIHTCFVETFPYLLILLLIRADWLLLDAVIVSLALLGSLTAQLGQQIRDYALDRQFERNFTIMVGVVWARRLQLSFTAVLILITILSLIANIFPLFLLPFGLILLPAVWHRLRPFRQPRRVVVMSVVTGLVYTGVMVIGNWVIR